MRLIFSNPTISIFMNFESNGKFYNEKQNTFSTNVELLARQAHSTLNYSN